MVMEDDFKYYGDYFSYREYPDASDDAETMEGMQLAMGSRGVSAEQTKKFQGQTMVDYIGSEAKEAVEVVGGGMAEMGAATIKGAAQGFVGLPGDIEMIGRGVTEIFNRGGDESKVQAFLRGMQEKTILPTTEDVKKWLDTNVGKVGKGDNPYETIGEVVAPGGYVKGAKLVGKGVTTAAKEAAPIIGEAFERYAATTGLTSYIVQPKRTLGTLVKKLESGAMDEQSYIEGTKLLNDALQKRPEKVTPDDLVRGADHVTSRLLASLSPTAKIQLQEPTVRFAKWLLDNNPQLANELGISIKGRSAKGYQAGKYTTDTGDNLIDRVATIFASNARETTAVHEILHHTEQMMPIEIQNGVTDAWTKGYLKTYRESSPEVQAYLKFIPKAISGDRNAQQEILNGFKDGVLNYEKHYQFVNPSEYWAVNATRLMQSRYEAGSWIGKAKVWLNEFTEKAKGAFGLQSDAPVLKGLQSVIKGTGELQTGMLVRSSNVSESANRVRQQKVKREKTISNIKKGAAVTATGAALTGDEGQQ